MNNAGYIRMVETLIFDHPAGWATIVGADWRLEPGYVENLTRGVAPPPRCYCHGDLSWEPLTLVCVNEGHHFCLGEDCQAEDIEWAYRLTPEGLEVWERVSFQGSWRHKYRQTVSWIVPNPRQVMARIENIGQEEE